MKTEIIEAQQIRRNKAIVERWIQLGCRTGWTTIGREFGLSPQWVKRIVSRFTHKLRRESEIDVIALLEEFTNIRFRPSNTESSER